MKDEIQECQRMDTIIRLLSFALNAEMGEHHIVAENAH